MISYHLQPAKYSRALNPCFKEIHVIVIKFDWFSTQTLPMNDVMFVKIVQSQNHLSSKKSCFWLGEHGLFAHVMQQLPSWEEIHHQIDFAFGLEGIMKTGNKRMVDIAHDITFGNGVVYVVGFN